MPVLPIEAAGQPERSWGPPFPPEEYLARLRRTLAEMARRTVDALVVTSPANITWLTGYDSIWYRRSTPTCLVVHGETGELLFFDDRSHRELIRMGTARLDRIACFHRFRETTRPGWLFKNTGDDILDTLAALGWLRGKVGLEHWSPHPNGQVMGYLAAGIEERGGTPVDGSWLVDRVKLVKSPAELAVLREAGAIADAAMASLRDFIRPGVTEKQVQGHAHRVMAERGGEEPAIRTIVCAGPRAAAHHALPTARPIGAGEIVVVDFCASLERYHADLARTFFTGREPDPRWLRLADAAEAALAAIVAGLRPGDPMERAVELAAGVLDARGVGARGWFIGGYDLGIAVPPDWVGHTYLNGLCFERADFVPGTVTNFEVPLDVLDEDWPGGNGYSVIDTLVMTETGVELLSAIPPRLMLAA